MVNVVSMAQSCLLWRHLEKESESLVAVYEPINTMAYTIACSSGSDSRIGSYPLALALPLE
jgi:hypothetical protein